MFTVREGVVREIVRPLIEQDPVTRLRVEDTYNQIIIDNVQMPLVDDEQITPEVGSIILFYRTSASDAKYIRTLRDAGTISSPIERETATVATFTGELTFHPGEVAKAARGFPNQIIPTKGASMYLKNTGDGMLYSGEGTQRISVNDSSNSIDITGNNLDIGANGNILFTHGINIDSDIAGLTSMKIGMRNPSTGIFVNRFGVDTVGNMSMGTEEPISGTTLTGITYTSIPTVTTPIVPDIKLTAVPLLSTFEINTASAELTSPIVDIKGTALTKLGDTTSLITNVQGATINETANLTINYTAPTITTTAATAADIAAPVITLTATTGVTITSPIVFNYIGTLIPISNSSANAAGIFNALPITVNGIPKLIYTN